MQIRASQSMRNFLLTLTLFMATLNVHAQKEHEAFRAYLFNNEYEVYLRINLYDQDITVPGHELYGKLPGYLGKKNNSFCWVITSCDVKSDKKAVLQLINDFGSEELTATLVRKNDSIYQLRQDAGSTLKVPHKNKWQKLSKTILLKRK